MDIASHCAYLNKTNNLLSHLLKKKIVNITYNLPELKLPTKSEIDLRSTHKLGDNI